MYDFGCVWVCINYCLLIQSCTCILKWIQRLVIYEIFINLKSEEMIIDYISINGTRCLFFDVLEGFHQLLNTLSLDGCKTLAFFRDKYQSGEF